MSTFAENLATLPTVDELAGIELTAPDGRVERIENRPGSQGSMRVYRYLLTRHGVINTQAAAEGLALYAEHGDDARAHPGKHPNIDRLLLILADGQAWRGRLQAA